MQNEDTVTSAGVSSIVNQTEQLRIEQEEQVDLPDSLQPPKRARSTEPELEGEQEVAFENPQPADPMLQKFLVTAVTVTSSVPVKSFATNFLGSASLRKASAQRNASGYIASLSRLCETEGQHLAITSTEYEFANKTKVQLFDVRCKVRFEDDLVDRICRSWINRDGAKYGPVCPLRRGICVGLINNEYLILAVGNCKFFYGDESEILGTLPTGELGTVLLSEKANGEYTMLASTSMPFDGGVLRWITVGSKNVRVCLPHLEGDPSLTHGVFESFVFQFNRQNGTKEEGHRYSYLGEMLDLWLKALHAEDSKHGMLAELDRGTTLVGEQVGVHAHIFTGYDRPHIRLFGSLPYDTLHTEMACNLLDLKQRVFHNADWKYFQLVNLETFRMPEQDKDLRDGLERVAAGSMDVYGEGVVVYVYNGKGQCLNLYKFKCQEYAFDRRLRTVLSRTAGELSRTGLSRLKLKDETARITQEMKRAYETQFTKMNPARAEERTNVVPAMLAFLDRHQATLYCADFSENFTSFIDATMARKQEYNQLAERLFLQVDDVLQAAFTSFLSKFESVTVPVRTVTDLAQEIVAKWKQHGGREKFHCIGIASGPGGGKTAILQEVHRLLEAESPDSSKICDRDAYVIADPSAKGDVIHRQWVDDISHTALKEHKVVLVGNTFTGGFADKLETQTKTKLLLFAVKEHTIPVAPKRLVPSPSIKRGVLNWTADERDKAKAAMFDLTCLRRLSQRIDTHADGSTLSMGLGCKIVLDKFFSSQPEDQMLKRRLKEKTAVMLEMCDDLAMDFNNLQQLEDVARSICQLKHTVANPPIMTASTSKNIDDDPGYVPRVPRGNFTKVTFPYYKKAHTKPKVKYAAIVPEPDSAKMAYALADADIIRADGHITLMYQPSDKEISELLRRFKDHERIEVELTARVTVVLLPGKGKLVHHKLQFVVAEAKVEAEKSLLPAAAHVTLGSTNADLLPYVTSGKVLANLIESNTNLTERQGPLDATIEGTKYVVTIEPYDRQSVPLFVGSPHFVCNPK